jgi:membrane protein implicated in regulation of membrane protease activity
MCHLILALPFLGLMVFWLWPLSVAAPVYAAIFLLSLLMYYLILQAMRRPVVTGAEEILQEIGRVIEVKKKKARIRVHSEIWNAVSTDRLRAGDQVEIMGVDGLVLRVRRLSAGRGVNITSAVSR